MSTLYFRKLEKAVMKKLLIIFFTIILVLFVGCSSKKDQKLTGDASIIVGQDSVSTPHDSTPTTDDAAIYDEDASSTKDVRLSDDIMIPGC